MKRRKSRNNLRVVVRFRPLLKDEISVLSFVPRKTEDSSSHIFVPKATLKGSELKYGPFHKIFVEEEKNNDVFNEVLKPFITQRFFGNICCFGYGHSGSGKTHTIFGYGEERGLFKLSIDEMLRGVISKRKELFLSISFAEVYNDKIFDLMNNGAEMKIKAGLDGMMQIRSLPKMDKKTGFVRVNPLKSYYTRNSTEAMKILKFGIDQRSVGNSSIHDQSSRSHAILRIEVVTKEMIDIREEILKVESEIHPVGKKRDDYLIYFYLHQHPEVKYKKLDRGLIPEDIVDELPKLEIEVARLQKIIDDAKMKEQNLMRKYRERNGIEGSDLMFIDLAGSDYENMVVSDLSPEEKKESRLINLSLLSLKECIRSINMKKSHVPFRNSKLTLVLKRFLLSEKSRVLMIANASPCESQEGATKNTLKYASLLAKSTK